jgi:hypothetical protein
MEDALGTWEKLPSNDPPGDRISAHNQVSLAAVVA